MANRYLTPWSGSRQWQGDPLFQLQREIDRVFDDVFGGSGRSGGGTMMNAPRIDLHEEQGELCLRADLPGIQPQDLEVRVDGDMLTIGGERKSEQNRDERDYHVMERSHGRFQRSVQLPFTPNPDEVRAEVRHGVLEIRIPKRAAQERSRRIEVRGEGGEQLAGGGAAMTQAVGGGGANAGSAAGGSSGSAGSGGSGGGEGSRSDTAMSDAASSGNVGQAPGGSGGR